MISYLSTETVKGYWVKAEGVNFICPIMVLLIPAKAGGRFHYKGCISSPFEVRNKCITSRQHFNYAYK